VTDAFVREVDVQKTALGAEQLQPVVIAHPLSTLTSKEIIMRATTAAHHTQRVLLGQTV